MAYIERPGNVCDQQTLRRVQKGWTPRYAEWIHEPTIDGKHAQLLRHLGEIHSALSQGELRRPSEVARTLWKVRAIAMRLILWNPKGSIRYMDTQATKQEKLIIPVVFNGGKAFFFESIPGCFLTDAQKDLRQHLSREGDCDGSIEVAQ